MSVQKIVLLISVLGVAACSTTVQKQKPYIDYANDQLIAQLQESYPMIKVNHAFIGKKSAKAEAEQWQMICGNLDAQTSSGPWLKQKRFYIFVDGAEIAQLSAEQAVIDDPQSDAFHEEEWQEFCQK
ncbi:hypothetical protein VQ643_00040 [Pseudomonas sp. F1_0610]|uniref:hypothetical protein n=1 Tax=Pseudomonas sp. F1_0610 TaxID=3114284 RepID=UPI0039C409C9